ncbi:MAG: hypothetical protein JXQ23_06555 [Clostridia bacterium]|nr:hypothetical protein [Clostridia bacterium]
MMDKKDLKKHFDSPQSIDRSAPFWSWNDRLNPEEIKRQAHDMHDKGMGGFFMHSRVGLETEYMSDEWLENIKAACEQAKEDGTKAWLYDEDRWPSGGAGGLVYKADRDFGSKGITARINDDQFESVLCKYNAVIEEGKLKSLREYDSVKKDNEVTLYIGYDYTTPMEWFNDTPGTDNINKETVKEFIRTSYEPYKEHFSEYFGNVIPGVFTDEPNINSANAAYERDDIPRVPWTREFDEFFLNKRGYDFYTYAPYLFIDGDYSKKIRHDYFRTLGEIFTINFSKQLYDWCDENGIAFTGHWLAENRMGAYIHLSGSVMPNYMYEHIPGIDMLGEKCIEFMTIKKCTSVGNQMRRERMLSETYGVSGWHFDFEGQKWIGDYQFVLGINLRCQHLAWYSMRGCRKRDYPPQFNYQTTWWEYNNIIEDYFARISSITSKGYAIRDVLVIHPLATAWSKAAIKAEDYRLHEMGMKIDEIGYDLNDFTRFLLGQHYDLDYGDEDIMSQIGKVKDNTIMVGQAGYKLAVIPPMCETLYQSTVEILIEFMNNGGKVIAFENLPQYIETEENSLITTMNSHKNLHVVKNNRDLIDTLDQLLGRVVSIADENGYECDQLMYMLREHGEAQSLYITNNDRDKGYETFITVKGNKVEEWDLLSGETLQAVYHTSGENLVIKTSFGPSDSKMYVISDHALDSAPDSKKPYEAISYLGPECDFTRCDPNVLVLDMCQVSVKGSEYNEKKEIFIQQEDFRKSLGMKSIRRNEGVQRYKWIYEEHKNNHTPVSLKYTFDCIDLPADTYLVVERVDNFNDIILNGKKVPVIKDGWHMDRDFDKIKLDGIIRGENTLILNSSYTHDMEFENIYIIGDFGVNVKRQLVSEPDRMHFGDWALQGYLFYPGSMIYQFDYMKTSEHSEYILEIPEFSASLIEIFINKKHAAYVPWKAKNKVDISQFLKEGNNEIGIKLVGTPRNMFGPFHFANSHNRYYSSYTFTADAKDYTEDYLTYPYGLFEQICIYGL